MPQNPAEPIEIDGSLGEAGGQVLRTSLGLAALLKKPVKIINIRAARTKPGLRPQHLAAAKTIAMLCNAPLENAGIGSTEILFKPNPVVPTNLNVNIGTAGSISLLLSQIMPPAIMQETTLHVSGGTNVPFSPPIEFMQHALLPALHRIGARFELKLGKRGYFPKGNGSASFSSKPAALPLKPIKIVDFGSLEFVNAFSHCASLPKDVAKNQASAAKAALASLNAEFDERIECREKAETIGSGITLLARTSSKAILSGSALGARGKPAEEVGNEAAHSLLQQLSTKEACDLYLADQLIPFMGLAKGRSELHTTSLSKHCTTNIAIVEKMLPVNFSVKGKEGSAAEISVEGAGFKQPT